MVGIFGLGCEMQVWKRGVVGKFRVAVEELNHTTTLTLQDGEHERGDFKAPANTSDVVDHVHVHVNGCWNRSGF